MDYLSFPTEGMPGTEADPSPHPQCTETYILPRAALRRLAPSLHRVRHVPFFTSDIEMLAIRCLRACKLANPSLFRTQINRSPPTADCYTNTGQLERSFALGQSPGSSRTSS